MEIVILIVHLYARAIYTHTYTHSSEGLPFHLRMESVAILVLHTTYLIWKSPLSMANIPVSKERCMLSQIQIGNFLISTDRPTDRPENVIQQTVTPVITPKNVALWELVIGASAIDAAARRQ